MKKGITKYFCTGLCFLLLFVIWTSLVKFIDVKPIGPYGSEVGFSSLNNFVAELTGVHMGLYHITDILSLVPFIFIIGFALLGLVQWIKRRNIFKVDYNILILGVFYIVTLFLFVLFEVFVVNYRPVLIGGQLEASYPSSTTMLTMCVMPTSVMQFNRYIKGKTPRLCIAIPIIIFTAFMVAARLISGVHWFTDIIGGALLSTGLVMIYRFICTIKQE